jgi:hypothetical protein
MSDDDIWNRHARKVAADEKADAILEALEASHSRHAGLQDAFRDAFPDRRDRQWQTPNEVLGNAAKAKQWSETRAKATTALRDASGYVEAGRASTSTNMSTNMSNLNETLRQAALLGRERDQDQGQGY